MVWYSGPTGSLTEALLVFDGESSDRVVREESDG